MMLKAQHILVAHEFEAKDILKKLEQGVSFEKLASDFSMCPSSRQGGNLGEFPKGRMVPAFEKALLQLEPGQTSGVVRTQFGHHIIKRL
jgi:peptidyl-prolyl cis-trans isomerase C